MPKKKKPQKEELETGKKHRTKKEQKEEETFHVDIDLSEPSEQGLEELTESPQEIPTETSEFSEFMIPETSASDMPTLTLPSPSSPSLAEPTENLEESASSSIATTSGTVSPVRGGGGAGNLYSGADYGDYFGKSYSETNYKPREEEIRNLLKQNIAEKPIMPVTPVSQRWQDERIQQANVEDWGRGEKELRDYTIESIAKKEVKKRKLID